MKTCSPTRTASTSRARRTSTWRSAAAAHFCLGANLARLETRALFQQVLTRLPDLRLAGPVERLRSIFINGPRRMPVAFTPTRA